MTPVVNTDSSDLCVIFDVDGTLCDTAHIDDVCYRHAAAAALGITPQEANWQHAPHHTDSGIAKWLWACVRGRPPSRIEVENFRRDFVHRLEAARLASPERFRSIPGAASLLDGLVGSGARVGIGTGGWRASAAMKLAAAGLGSDLLYGTADDHEARREVFSLAWSRATAGSTPASTVLVGDSVCDVETARQLSWRFVGIGKGSEAAVLLEAGARTILSDFSGAEVQETIRLAEPPHP